MWNLFHKNKILLSTLEWILDYYLKLVFFSFALSKLSLKDRRNVYEWAEGTPMKSTVSKPIIENLINSKELPLLTCVNFHM